MAITISMTGIASTVVLGTPVPATQPRLGLHATLHADLENAFFNEFEFAVFAAYTHVSGESATYKGQFDEAFESVSFGAEVPVSSTAPHLLLMQHSMIRSPRKGDSMTIKGVRYTVDDWKPDGVGLIDLVLVKEDR